MIKPNKFTDMNNCLLSIGADILLFLKNRGAVTLTALNSHFDKDYLINSDEYKYALDFLYSIGCIDYNIANDEVVLLK